MDGSVRLFVEDSESMQVISHLSLLTQASKTDFDRASKS